MEIAEIIQKIRSIQGDPVIVLIDGRCASGKSTLAGKLQSACGASLIHLDDFFLRPEQRTEERYRTPGENVDHERFLQEVLLPVQEGKPAVYEAFDCRKMEPGEKKQVEPHGVILIEGSYSMRPDFRKYADLCIFLTVDPQKQLERLERRDPSKLQMFREKWIPLEEAYFDAFKVEKEADLVIDTSILF